MSVTGSLRARRPLALCWLVFAGACVSLMWLLPGEETIPYHFIWASYALLYGLYAWSRATTQVSFWAVSVATGIPLVLHARSGAIGWSECAEIVLMAVLVALLIWHVNRHRAVQQRITELRETERVRAHNRELAARFGSHEVRTHLTVARGFVELMHDATTDAAVRSSAELMLSELDKASGLATKLLTLVRVGAASPRAPVQMDDLVEEVVRRWAGTSARDWSWGSSVGFMLGDAERIEAALDCLIENAVTFTEQGDAIRVAARLDQGDVVLSVTDAGAGIPQDDLKRVLEIFQTGSNAGDRAGCGLGLAIVRAIVEARHGSLDLSSMVGVGSCFTMRVPADGYRPVQLPVTVPLGATSTGWPELAWNDDMIGAADRAC